MVSTITTTDVAATLMPAPERDAAAVVEQEATTSAAEMVQTAADFTGYGEKLAADTSLALLSTQEQSVDPLDALLDTMDVNGDGVLDARDVATSFLQSELEAAIKRQERTVMDSGMAHAATRNIDTNHDGVISAEEKQAVYG